VFSSFIFRFPSPPAHPLSRFLRPTPSRRRHPPFLSLSPLPSLSSLLHRTAPTDPHRRDEQRRGRGRLSRLILPSPVLRCPRNKQRERRIAYGRRRADGGRCNWRRRGGSVGCDGKRNWRTMERTQHDGRTAMRMKRSKRTTASRGKGRRAEGKKSCRSVVSLSCFPLRVVLVGSTCELAVDDGVHDEEAGKERGSRRSYRTSMPDPVGRGR
jgi:hypothetical protein